MLDWLREFVSKYLTVLDPVNLDPKQQMCFLLKWHDNTRDKLGPDLQGTAIRNMLHPERILAFSLDEYDSVVKQREEGKFKFDDFSGISLNPSQEPTAILLEICKYYGKEVHIVEMYGLYKKCHAGLADFPEPRVRIDFLKALHELKYCGLVSATKQNTYLFKKNFFGRAGRSQI